MSKNNNIASMYQKEYDELRNSIIDSIKFIALENNLGRIELNNHPVQKFIVEFQYKVKNNKKNIEWFKVYFHKNEKVSENMLQYNTILLIELLRLLEEKSYTILS